jgi:23S rRNA pseudouridine2605 synthase
MKNEKSDFFKPRQKAEKKVKDYDELDRQRKEKSKNKHSEDESDSDAEQVEVVDLPKISEPMRLNKYIAHSGVCSRREADKLIEKGLVTINGKVITEMGYKVQITDKVICKGKNLNPETFQYVLLNKPKDFITTTKDENNRRTVMNLISTACDERVNPVGRLDRNTTGLLLFTNDGELANKLMHPSGMVKKIYQATLDKPFAEEDFEKLKAGITLEDGPVWVDDLATDEGDHRVVGLEIHLGRTRIVRRIFEHLGYEVIKLDRTIFAGLTKKDLPRGKFRHLKPTEISHLKMLPVSKSKPKKK